MSIPLQHSEREGWSRTAPDDARRVTGFSPEFVPGGDFTLGAEEEALLVQRNGRLRTTGAVRLAAALSHAPATAGLVVPDVFANQVELNSAVCDSAESLHRSMRQLREQVRAAGAWLMAVGTHPAAEFGAIRTVSNARAKAIHDEFVGLLRAPTSALQIHVGFPDTETAMTAYHGLRHQLPVLRALGASSPMWHGQDSGLVSTRAAIMWSYPRVGIPPGVRDYEDYVHQATTLMSAAEVADESYLWWDMRVQPQLGTLEVRVLDSQPSLEHAAGLAALIQGMARAAVERPLTEHLPSAVLAENDFRAVRYGLDARIFDMGGVMRPIRLIAGQALTRARDALRGDRLDAPLDVVAAMLWEPTEAARQRGVFREKGLPALLRDLTHRTNGLGSGDEPPRAGGRRLDGSSG